MKLLIPSEIELINFTKKLQNKNFKFCFQVLLNFRWKRVEGGFKKKGGGLDILSNLTFCKLNEIIFIVSYVRFTDNVTRKFDSLPYLHLPSSQYNIDSLI